MRTAIAISLASALFTSVARCQGNTITVTATSTSTPSSTPSGQRTTWWDTHWKWVLMVIVLFIGFILIAVVGVLLKRRHDRKQDELKSSFNPGITHRSAPMVASAGPAPAPHHGPSGHVPHGSGSMYLPRVRERDHKAMQESQAIHAPEERGSTQMNELERGRLKKGKQRVEID